jgi:hypothetical protein
MSNALTNSNKSHQINQSDKQSKKYNSTSYLVLFMTFVITSIAIIITTISEKVTHYK